MHDRIFRGDDDAWYYRARGNTQIGPFSSYADAERALQKRIRSWAGRTKPRTKWHHEWRPAKMLRRSATRHT